MASRREQIRWALETLASEEEQLAYEKSVPHVDITRELIEQWFTDTFHGKLPGEDPTFNDNEMKALTEFHRFYDERLHRLPVSQGTIRTWLACSIWREIMKQARTTLEMIPNELKA